MNSFSLLLSFFLCSQLAHLLCFLCMSLLIISTLFPVLLPLHRTNCLFMSECMEDHVCANDESENYSSRVKTKRKNREIIPLRVIAPLRYYLVSSASFPGLQCIATLSEKHRSVCWRNRGASWVESEPNERYCLENAFSFSRAVTAETTRYLPPLSPLPPLVTHHLPVRLSVGVAHGVAGLPRVPADPEFYLPPGPIRRSPSRWS